MKLLPVPQVKPIDKDAVIADLKRKLAATEYQMNLYKEQSIEYAELAHEYWCKLTSP